MFRAIATISIFFPNLYLELMLEFLLTTLQSQQGERHFLLWKLHGLCTFPVVFCPLKLSTQVSDE